jgi:hypothetical protein
MRLRFVAPGLLAAGLAACSNTPPLLHHKEQFGVTNVHSRAYRAPPAAACEAARRALLSQGYLVNAAKADLVEAKKSFQQDANTHVEIGFHVVCMAGRKGEASIAFANALHDRYTLKKSPSSASLGVGPFGSFSVPFSGSDDAMVKVASETITAPEFYERFFGLVAYYLAADDPGPDGKPRD